MNDQQFKNNENTKIAALCNNIDECKHKTWIIERIIIRNIMKNKCSKFKEQS